MLALTKIGGVNEYTAYLAAQRGVSPNTTWPSANMALRSVQQMVHQFYNNYLQLVVMFEFI